MTKASSLPTHFVDLVYTAALASYWHRDAFRRFLAACQVSEQLLATWDASESKRDLLDKLLPQLQQTESGRAIIQQMARNLADQASFPDLKRCEDYPEKLAAATEAVAAVQEYLARKDRDREAEREATERRERIAESRAKYARSEHDLGVLRARLDQLSTQIGSQRAGYEFQGWFYDLMAFFEISHRRPYVAPGGRQIDGSITVEGTTYIVELKFTRDQSSPDDLDSIFGKVESKADNTMAIFVAMSGYSDSAKDAASKPGTPLLLLDYTHLYLVLNGAQNFQDVVARVRRHCSQTGRAFLAVADFGG